MKIKNRNDCLNRTSTTINCITQGFAILFVCAALLPTCDRAHGDDLAELEQQAMRAAVGRVAPSVVRIQTVGATDLAGASSISSGPCSGVVVSKDGYIISSAFHFASKPSAILVRLPDGSNSAARLVAHDHSRLLVLLKVDLAEDAAPLAVPEAAPADQLRVGAWAIAVGRTIDQGQPNVSVGILSAVNRIWGKAIQTDAKISPSNYGGPLVDISGRVLGILVPLSPQSNQKFAGLAWYDSGIGFAVPMEHIEQILPRLQAGTDLRPGLIGISFKGRGLYNAPTIAVVRVGSPAHTAGIKKGDTIVQVNGLSVANRAQLQHQTASLYAGDPVRLRIQRGSEELDFDVQLTDKLPPYQHPFAGILPMRDIGEKKGVRVRHVYLDSPAAKAGVQAGDLITKCDTSEIKSRRNLLDAFIGLEAGHPTTLTLKRGVETITSRLTLGRLPENVPDDVPAGRESSARPKDQDTKVGEFEITLPEFKNKCLAYVPDNYDARAMYGLVIWLPAPGKFDAKKLVSSWSAHCANKDLILLVPQSVSSEQWQEDELSFIVQTAKHIGRRYSVDETRTIVVGQRGGGAMAFLLYFSAGRGVHGVAAANTPMPVTIRVPHLNPTRRAAVYWSFATESATTLRIKAQIQQLRRENYPVTERSSEGKIRPLSEKDIFELARWIDSLDRI